MLRLLRPPLAASFLRSFRLHSPRYARETIAKNMLARVALVTASISQTGSCPGCRLRCSYSNPTTVTEAGATCNTTFPFSTRAAIVLGSTV